MTFRLDATIVTENITAPADAKAMLQVLFSAECAILCLGTALRESLNL